jgi:hypothetical protein
MKANRVTGPEGSVETFLSILRKEFVEQLKQRQTAVLSHIRILKRTYFSKDQR